MSGSSLLLQGLQSRLESNIKLKKKLNLAINTIRTSNIPLQNKEHVIFNWFINVLEEKICNKTYMQPEAESLWEGFLVCLRKIDTDQISVTLKPEFLSSIVYIDDASETVCECIQILCWLLYKQDPDSPVLADAINVCLNKDPIATNLCHSLLSLMENWSPSKLSNFTDIGKLLAKLSQEQSASDTDSLKRLIGKILFTNLDQLKAFFDSLESSDNLYVSKDTQYVIDYLSNGGDVALLINCSKSTSTVSPTWLEPYLLCIGLHFHGISIFTNGPDAFSSFYSSSSANALAHLLSQALPISDTEFEVNKTRVGNYITDAVRCCLENDKLSDVVCKIVSIVGEAHPMLLEPLNSQILAVYLSDECAPGTVFQVIVELMKKLRQLPKMVSKLLLYLRSINQLSVWSSKDLAVFAEAIIKAPRVQSIEIWTTLLYHISNDCVPNINEDSGRNMWKASAPLLSCLLNTAQLADHNIPQPLAARVRGLVQNTLDQVLCKLMHHPFHSEDQIIFAELASSLINLTDLIANYRDEEFENATKFKDSIIKLVLEQKRLDGFADVVIQVLCSGGSVHDVDLWRTFHKQLIANPKYFSQVFQFIPANYFSGVTEVELSVKCHGMRSATNSGVKFSGHSLYLAFRKLRHIEILKSLDDIPQEMWTCPGDMQSLQSKLGVAIEGCLQRLQLNEPLAGVSNKNKTLFSLDDLPSCVETLPKVQRLAVTLLCLCRLKMGDDGCSDEKKFVQLLGRCLEGTDLFRFMDAAKFSRWAVDRRMPKFLMQVLAKEFVRFNKMLSDMLLMFDLFSEDIIAGHEDCQQLFICLLEEISKPLLDESTSTEKRSTAAKLAQLITKCLTKHAKNEEILLSSDILVRAAAAAVKIYYQSNSGEVPAKLDKFIRKIVDCGLAEKQINSLLLINRILDSQVGQHLLTADDKTAARQIALDFHEHEESIRFISLMLTSNDATSIEELCTFNSVQHTLLMSTALMSSQLTFDMKKRLRPFTEQLTFKLLSMAEVSSQAKSDYVLHLLSATPALVSACVESAAITIHLSEGIEKSMFRSSESMLALVKFVRNRPNLCLRQIPLLCQTVRQNLRAVFPPDSTTSTSPPEAVDVCVAMQQLCEAFKKRQVDFANVAPYMIGEVLNAHLNSVCLKCKHVLTACLNLLLDICDVHNLKYLSVNLPDTCNHMFKQILKDYKINHKFTGKNI